MIDGFRFAEDGNLTLIQRLGHNVIKVGLRRINVAYSRISLQDIADKLGFESVQSAEFICAKAIRDGVLDGFGFVIGFVKESN